MNQLPTQSETLPVLIHRAAEALAEAKTSGEVLEARDIARVAYDAAKSAGRMARAKKAHDEILSAVYRAQADALLIEARAKMRLADEYDAAQERGEVVGAHDGARKRVEDDNAIATAADLGLRRDEIHEARQMRNLEREDPGVIERTLNDMVERGEEPTKAALKHVHVAANSGNNEWYTPHEFIDAARHVMGGIDLDPASSEIANATVQAERIFTAEDDGLSVDWPQGRVWMNPPYAQPLITQFSEKYALHMKAGASEGIVLVNNATETNWFQHLASVSSAACFPKGRIRFLDPNGNLGAPLQGQAILYSGNRPDAFAAAFRKFGAVWRNE